MAQNKKEQIAVLEHTVDSLTGRVDRLEQQLSQRTDDFNRMVQKMAQCNDEKNQLTQELDKANQSVKQLQQSLQETQQKLQAADARIAELNKEIESLREEMSKSKSSAIPKEYSLVYEFSISGHPKYAKALLFDKLDDESGAIVYFYDRSGNLVEFFDGYGDYGGYGYQALFEDDNISMGYFGPRAEVEKTGPYFEEKGKSYSVKIVNL